MLSQKLQDDLMTAYQKVYEEKRGHAAGSDDTEKQASQLASDVRYKAKGKIPEGASEEEKRKIFLQILAASPAPNVVKSMAKEKLLGEEVVHEKFGLKTAAKKLTSLDKKLQNVTKEKVKQKAKDVVFGRKDGKGISVMGTTNKGKLVRAAAGGTAAYMIGRKGEADANINRSNTYRSLVDQGFKPKSNITPLSSRSVKYEEVVNEMRFDDGKEGKEKRKEALRKKRGLTKDQMDKHPQFKVKEGTSYGIYKGDGVMKIGKKEEEKAPRKQKGAMAYDGPNKERSEAADRVLAKTKKKREEKKKMKEEYVNEMAGMAKKVSGMKKKVGGAAKRSMPKSPAPISKPKITPNRKPIDPMSIATKAAAVGTGVGLGMAYKKTQDQNESAGETIGEMKEKSKPKDKNPQNMALPKGVKSGVNYQTMTQSYKPVGNIFNEKKMDPVGAEDKDIDNDGDHDSTDKYLLKRRKAIGKAIAKKRGKVKEGFSAWRIDLDFNEQVKK